MKNLTYVTKLTGIVNASKITVEGAGCIDEDQGITNGVYQLVDIPQDFAVQILGGLLITGYPNACRELAGVENVFKGHSYSYTRELDFGIYGNLCLESDVQCDEDHLKSTFKVSGDVQVPFIDAIEPLVESWTPSGKEGKMLDGFFRYGFRTKKGILYADAKSVYAPGRASTATLHRNIQLTADFPQNRVMHLNQKVLLYDTLV